MVTTRRTVLRTVGIVGGTVAFGGFAYAQEQEEQEQENGGQGMDEGKKEKVKKALAIRAVHGSPDAPNVDVFVDDNKVLSDVSFTTVSEYMSLEPGMHRLKITPTGEPETEVFATEKEIGEGRFTLVAIGKVEDGSLQVLVVKAVETEKLQEAKEKKAALVRVIHGSPDAPAIKTIIGRVKEGKETGEAPAAGGSNDEAASEDTTEEETMSTDTLEFGDISEYLTVPAGTSVAQVMPADDTEADAISTLDLDLEPGTAYTVFALGFLKPQGEQPGLSLIVAEDATAEEEEMGEDEGEASEEEPSEGETPAEQPSEGETPAEQPSEGETPAEQPSEGETPAGQPAEGESKSRDTIEWIKS
ncbi:DUF4397 domain-containing protein [Haloarchaeobius sp. DFWS5]|uniref:DUF4397 domain-containing protein n=1 Tax=Haloarchaeobius sp. DFWS5 TaxID=3446114 RepID=UPI003EC14767